ncbi:MAG: BMP family protein [Oscillospiraceae bacterium]|nr:BMP family protein [Oscillospiraceae bacterium]
MKKIFALLIVLMMGISLFAGCGGGTAPAAPTTPAQDGNQADAGGDSAGGEGEGIRVAAIFSGPINDGAWNETQYNGLRRMEGRGASISFVENISDADSVEVMRAFAAEGFDLIFLTTNGYQDLCFPLTGDFPDTMFIQLNGTIISDNFISVRVPNEEQGFLAGIIAALYTQTGTVGFVGGQDITPIIIGSLGFQQGVDYVNEHFGTNVTAVRINTGNFHDANQAKETAISMIEAGADVVVPMADAAGVGVVEAVQERGVMTVGTGPGHAIMAPESVIATIMRDNAYVYDAVWEMFVSGNWPTEVEAHGVARGVVYAVGWLDHVDSEIIDRLAQVMDSMRAGEIYIDRGL